MGGDRIGKNRSLLMVLQWNPLKSTWKFSRWRDVTAKNTTLCHPNKTQAANFVWTWWKCTPTSSSCSKFVKCFKNQKHSKQKSMQARFMLRATDQSPNSTDKSSNSAVPMQIMHIEYRVYNFNLIIHLNEKTALHEKYKPDLTALRLLLSHQRCH